MPDSTQTAASKEEVSDLPAGTPVYASARFLPLQFLLLVVAVITYNRLVYGLHTPGGNQDFSTWAAPLYAFSQPIPKITPDVLVRWITPLLLAGGWIWLNAQGLRKNPIRFGSHLRFAIGVAILLNITTAMMDQGVKSIWWPFGFSQEDYYPDAAHVTDPTHLLRDYPTLNLGRHPRTHPPGGVLLLWIVRKTVGDGVITASLFAIVVTALTLIPAALLARRLIGESAAMVFIALYVLTPNLVIFGATSMDGVFAFFLNWAAYFFFSAALDQKPSPWRGVNLGIWLAMSTFLTYASIALVAVMVIWLLWNHDRRMLTQLAIAGMTMIGCFAILYAFTRCNMIACLTASMHFDANLMRPVREHYFDASVTNLLGFIVGSGLITSTLWLRDCACDFASVRRRLPIAGALFIAVVAMSFSTLFSRELERVWMFLTPLLLIGAARNLNAIQSESSRRSWVIGTLVLLAAQTWFTQLFLYTIW